jgi:hypothetical protein
MPVVSKFDLNDRAQVRQMSRRLGAPEGELRRIAERIGTSIAAISKEVALQRQPLPVETPEAAVIEAVVPEIESTATVIVS